MPVSTGKFRMSNVEDGLTAQQRSFRATMIVDLTKVYANRGCCNRVALEGGSDFKRMEYGMLMSYWETAFPDRKAPTGAERDARKW